MSKIKRAFVAGNHLCWFSKNENYRSKTVNEVLKIDPKHIAWCKINLKHLRFATGLKNRINKSLTPKQ